MINIYDILITSQQERMKTDCSNMDGLIDSAEGRGLGQMPEWTYDITHLWDQCRAINGTDAA